VAGGRGCSDAQTLQEVEAGVAMRRRETDEHVFNGNPAVPSAGSENGPVRGGRING
jgi:hypothetical protein